MKQKGNVLIILIILIVLALGITLYYKSTTSKVPSNVPGQPSETRQPTSTKSAEETKIFKSKLMQFSVDLPNNYVAEERIGSAIITTPNGEIYIDRNGTNFDNINDYIEDLEEKNRFAVSTKQSYKINNLETVAGIIDKEKAYFIYSNNAVYTLTAKDKSLFNDLDQIAKSFRYTP
ncbi:hypothetical protein HYU95_05720 [Candidatus Daviesbacteria bacterium]|nr:hypothetical protein [Candidatus Daviesbacteria bacterium]